MQEVARPEIRPSEESAAIHAECIRADYYRFLDRNPFRNKDAARELVEYSKDLGRELQENPKQTLAAMNLLLGVDSRKSKDIYNIESTKEILGEVVHASLATVQECLQSDDEELAAEALRSVIRVTASYPAHPEVTGICHNELPKLIWDFRVAPPEKLSARESLAHETIQMMSDHFVTQKDETKRLDQGIYQYKDVLFKAFGLNDASAAKEMRYYMACRKRQRHTYESEVANNLNTMAILEHYSPGLVDTLAYRDKIRNFDRFAAKTWLAMEEDRTNNPEMNYVQLVMAAHDFNGAFVKPARYENLYRQLKRKGVTLRVFECQSQDDLDYMTMQTEHDFNAHGAKIACEVMMGHGNPDGLAWGQDKNTKEELHRYSSKNLSNYYHANRIAEFMVRNAKQVFISCLTGYEQEGKYSVARKSAATLGKVAVAPRASVGFGKMRALKNGDAVDVAVDFLRINKKHGKLMVRKTGYVKFQGDLGDRQVAMGANGHERSDAKRLRDVRKRGAKALVASNVFAKRENGKTYIHEVDADGKLVWTLDLKDEKLSGDAGFTVKPH